MAMKMEKSLFLLSLLLLLFLKDVRATITGQIQGSTVTLHNADFIGQSTPYIISSEISSPLSFLPSPSCTFNLTHLSPSSLISLVSWKTAVAAGCATYSQLSLQLEEGHPNKDSLKLLIFYDEGVELQFWPSQVKAPYGREERKGAKTLLLTMVDGQAFQVLLASPGVAVVAENEKSLNDRIFHSPSFEGFRWLFVVVWLIMGSYCLYSFCWVVKHSSLWADLVDVRPGIFSSCFFCSALKAIELIVDPHMSSGRLGYAGWLVFWWIPILLGCYAFLLILHVWVRIAKIGERGISQKASRWISYLLHLAALIYTISFTLFTVLPPIIKTSTSIAFIIIISILILFTFTLAIPFCHFGLRVIRILKDASQMVGKGHISPALRKINALMIFSLGGFFILGGIMGIYSLYFAGSLYFPSAPFILRILFEFTATLMLVLALLSVSSHIGRGETSSSTSKGNRLESDDLAATTRGGSKHDPKDAGWAESHIKALVLENTQA